MLPPIGEGGGGRRYHAFPQRIPNFRFFIFSFFSDPMCLMDKVL